LSGHTNLLIYGSEILAGCRINATGSLDASATLTIDFGTDSCDTGRNITVNEKIIKFDEREVVEFGSAFQDIKFILSNCDDHISVEQTYSSASSIDIVGAAGNDRIVLGNDDIGFEASIFANIIVDGKDGDDVLVIKDGASSVLKANIDIRSSVIAGIHGNPQKRIDHFNVDEYSISLGSTSANVTVSLTSDGKSLYVATQNSEDVIWIKEGEQ
jgi:hypothetical protein